MHIPRRLLYLSIICILFVLPACGSNAASSASSTPSVTIPQVTATAPPTETPIPTQAPTLLPTLPPTPTPTQANASLPSPSELSKLLDSGEGSVTDASAPTTNPDGTLNIAVDVMVNNPTQSRIKHITLELAQFFFQQSYVNLVNFVFHASVYTGNNDPIANSGGVAPSNWAGMDEDQLWDALAGQFKSICLREFDIILIGWPLRTF